METLTPLQRRAYRAQAHELNPVVSIGQQGLTPSVLHEIDSALTAHELIKIRVFSDDRNEREALLARISSELGAAPVQHLGKVLIVWRRAPAEQDQDAPKPARSNAPRSKSASATTSRRRRRQT